MTSRGGRTGTWFANLDREWKIVLTGLGTAAATCCVGGVTLALNAAVPPARSFSRTTALPVTTSPGVADSSTSRLPPSQRPWPPGDPQARPSTPPPSSGAASTVPSTAVAAPGAAGTTATAAASPRRANGTPGQATRAPSRPPNTPPAQSFYADCNAARHAGATPLYRGEPGYRRGLDRDGDGVACDGQR